MLPSQDVAEYQIQASLAPQAKWADVIDAPSARLPASACKLRSHGRLRLPGSLDIAPSGFFVAR
jgi:hypothetical protein